MERATDGGDHNEASLSFAKLLAEVFSRNIKSLRDTSDTGSRNGLEIQSSQQLQGDQSGIPTECEPATAPESGR